ncbi:TetR/AcrR family transcriptional regulator [Paenibacillus sp. 481]|uniref:TetR/AcrR family transcriptional regulator n=1 Tax=Paenibacillus sp. 481 TaxID=2835869 RepID=UPI001E607F40|nr:TetR/AcrR family transcriptional regulator [Paenibacillus sp. 481]UHA76260.1 TetR/AcrR family transcriptional regulator [Paenibacillus sp. 481]
MRKGEQTRQHIIKKSAELFNQKGFAGCSMNDIMDATGLKKGGIYRTFSSKDELAIEALDYALERVAERFTEALGGANTAIDKMIALFDVYQDVVHNPPLVGGCPLLNTAVESDDTHPELRNKALQSMHLFLADIQDILQQGIANKELKAEIDVVSLSSFIVSLLEGSIMASKLAMSNEHMAYSKQQLTYFLRSLQQN